MNEKISVQDLAEILGLSRQHVYTSGKSQWGFADVENHAESLIVDARKESKEIKRRLKEYRKSLTIKEDLSGYTITDSDKKRFMKKVNVDDGGCWVWDAGLASHGYGQFRFRHKQMGAHRFSWWMHTGEYPEGAYVCHKCNNKACVNPDHLFLGTQQENMNHLKESRQNGYSK